MSEGHALKQRIHDGAPLNIAWAAVNTPQDELKARLMEDAYTMVFVDAQHAPFVEDDLVSFCATAKDVGVPVLLRIRHTHLAFLAGNYADLGPLGILIPQVETEATVDEAIRWFYYPPRGTRSWGPIHGYGRDAIQDRAAYAAWWNDHGILALQLESIDAVMQARSFAKPGVDLILFGGNDLSFSLETRSDSSFTSVEACCRYVADQLAGTGVRVASGFLPYGAFDGMAAEP